MEDNTIGHSSPNTQPGVLQGHVNSPQSATGGQQHTHGGDQQIAAPAIALPGADPNRWANIPTELRLRPQWCLAGPDSRPLQINGYNASSTAPGTWTDYESVRKRAIEIGQTTGIIPHIGYVLCKDDPYACIDLDVKNASSRNKKTGKPYPENQWTTQEQIDRFNKIIENFDSYTEVSSGGLGKHIWVKGSIGSGKKRDGVEVYSQERFIVSTGLTYRNKPIADRYPLLRILINKITGRSIGKNIPITDNQPLTEEDKAIIAKFYESKNDEKIRDLFEGRWEKHYPGKSQSEADLGLVGKLFFYQQLVYPSIEDTGQIVRLFLNSSLGKRDKAKRHDYLGPIIEMAWVTYLMDKGKKTLRVEHGRQQSELILAHSDRQAELAAKKKGVESGIPLAKGLTNNTTKEALQQPQPPMMPLIHIPVSLQDKAPINVMKKAVPQPFNYDEVPDCISWFANQVSQSTGFDHSGLIVAAVTAAGAVIDDRFRLEVRQNSRWYVSARPWSFLCGGSAAGKSPILRYVTDPIKAIHHEQYAHWMMSNKDKKPEEQEPKPQLYTSDATVAALSESLKDNPRGLLMLNEEFSSWVGSIDSSNKGDAAKNRGDWLQLRDGGPRQINRIIRGNVYVPNWGASVLAACTPDGLAKQMKDMPEDGLIQRFTPCILHRPDFEAPNRKIDCSQALDWWDQKLRWVHHVTTNINQESCIRFSADAQLVFDEEDINLRKLVSNTEDFLPSYACHLGKHPGMLAEVCLIFHVFSSNDTPSNEISVETVNTAIRYMKRIRRHAFYLYSTILTASPHFELAQRLARSIVAADKVLPTIGRDWMTQHCQPFKKADDRTRREAVQMLEDADWIEANSMMGPYGGWPRQFEVNQQVFTLFACEGEEWRAHRAAVLDAIGGEDI